MRCFLNLREKFFFNAIGRGGLTPCEVMGPTAVCFGLRVGRKTCRFPLFRGKGDGKRAHGPLDLARWMDMAHGKTRVGLQRFSSTALRDSLLTQSPVRSTSTSGFRRGRRRSPQGLRLLVSQMDGAADSCCPSSLCSFSVTKLE
jgi:hypothetical protein